MKSRMSFPGHVRPAQGTHAQAPTGRAYMDVISPDLIENLVHGEPGQHGLEPLVPLQAEDEFQVVFPVTVVEEAVITDLLEAGREHMHHEAPDEFQTGKGHLNGGGIIPAVLRGKGDGIPGDRLYPGIGDGDAVGIAPKVLNGIAEAIEGLPDVRAPGGTAKGIPEHSPGGRILQGSAGIRERELPGTVKGVQGGKELPFELCSEHPGRDKEMVSCHLKPAVFGKAAPGDDAVDVGVEVELLPPGMEYLDDAGYSAQELPVSGQLQQGLRGAPVEEGAEEGLVCIDRRVQLCRNCKHYMEIRRIDDLCPPRIDPDLFENGLVAGAAAVAAGIIVDLHMAAVTADGSIHPKLPGLAGHDGGSRFALYRGGAERSGILLPGTVKGLLDLKPVHGAHLPSCQKG